MPWPRSPLPPVAAVALLAGVVLVVADVVLDPEPVPVLVLELAAPAGSEAWPCRWRRSGSGST